VTTRAALLQAVTLLSEGSSLTLSREALLEALAEPNTNHSAESEVGASPQGRGPTLDAAGSSGGPDRLLTAEQAAALLNVAPRWCYRHAAELPFTRRIGRKTLRFSEAGLRRWLDRRR
jgi:predicted DNA-binding transcriptional regulator AlpA